MDQPRFRLFGGPNGSGKTFFFNHLKRSGYIHTEIYVSADKIEADLKKKPVFNFNAYRVKVSDAEFKQYVLTDGLFTTKINDSSFLQTIKIEGGILGRRKEKTNQFLSCFIYRYLSCK